MQVKKTSCYNLNGFKGVVLVHYSRSTIPPQILDFFSHHRNLLIQFIDVLTEAVTLRTHLTDKQDDRRTVTSKRFSFELSAKRCCCSTEISNKPHVGVPQRGSWFDLMVGQPGVFHETN